jgi:SAM-dependent methyltransferase
MTSDRTKPIPVEGPQSSRLVFFVRQLVDLQLKTIVSRLSSFLPTLTGRVLDIGAGQSPWKNFFNGSVQYQGVDIGCADKFGMSHRQDVVYYDGSTLPFPENIFDGAICIEVLEHCTDPYLLLNEAFRVLKPGAAFAITVPWSARIHHLPFDFHRFTNNQLNRMLSETGFINIDIQERGNDICVVANKLVVIGWRLLLPERKIHLLWSLLLAIPELCLAVVWLLLAHISLLLKLGSKDDPLGYFVTCNKSMKT